MNSLVVLALLVGNTAIGMAQLGRDGHLHLGQAWLLLTYTLPYVGLLTYLKARQRGPLVEPILLAALCAITGIGMAALARIDAGIALRQSYWLVLGVVLFGVVSHAPLWHYIRRYTYVWAGIGLALLAWTTLFGVEIRGARSWVVIGPIGFQPVEFVKIVFVFALASYLAEAKTFLAARKGGVGVPRARYTAPLLIMAVFFAAILVVQRDLGAALLLFGVVVTMVTVATASLRYAAVGLATVMIGAVLAASAFGHVAVRLNIWYNPWSLADGRGYQIVESLFALASGGFFGTGWGRGMAVRIPAVETDFVFSLLTEEIGLLGAAGVLLLLAIISLRTMAPASNRDHDDALRLGAVGLGLLFAMQSFLIVGGVTRLIPVTGITLPFVSYGGSSLIASFIQVGLAYNLWVLSESSERITRREEVGQWNEV